MRTSQRNLHHQLLRSGVIDFSSAGFPLYAGQATQDHVLTLRACLR
jgi:hypothetical protein